MSVGGHVAVCPSASGSNYDVAFMARISSASMCFIDCTYVTADNTFVHVATAWRYKNLIIITCAN